MAAERFPKSEGGRCLSTLSFQKTIKLLKLDHQNSNRAMQLFYNRTIIISNGWYLLSFCVSSHSESKGLHSPAHTLPLPLHKVVSHPMFEPWSYHHLPHLYTRYNTHTEFWLTGLIFSWISQIYQASKCLFNNYTKSQKTGYPPKMKITRYTVVNDMSGWITLVLVIWSHGNQHFVYCPELAHYPLSTIAYTCIYMCPEVQCHGPLGTNQHCQPNTIPECVSMSTTQTTTHNIILLELKCALDSLFPSLLPLGSTHHSSVV